MVQIFQATGEPWNRKKLQKLRQEKYQLKNKFIFYLRISRYSKVIYFVYHCQNYHEIESAGLEINKILKLPFGS